jgi:hypothetical protein
MTRSTPGRRRRQPIGLNSSVASKFYWLHDGQPLSWRQLWRKHKREALAAGVALAQAMAAAKKAAAKTKALAKALATSRGGASPPPKAQAHTRTPAKLDHAKQVAHQIADLKTNMVAAMDEAAENVASKENEAQAKEPSYNISEACNRCKNGTMGAASITVVTAAATVATTTSVRDSTPRRRSEELQRKKNGRSPLGKAQFADATYTKRSNGTRRSRRHSGSWTTKPARRQLARQR